MTLREDSDVTKGRQMGQLSPGATAEGCKTASPKIFNDHKSEHVA